MGSKETILCSNFIWEMALDVFSFVEAFFEFHSRATEGEKDKIKAKNNNFLAN